MASNVIAPFFVDAHCHLDLFPRPAELVASIESAQVHTVAVTNAPFVFQHTQKLCEHSHFVHPALGLHPELVATHGDQVDQLVTLLDQTRFVGEVGLDFVTPDRSLRKRQTAIFVRVLDACSRFDDKILTVHSRRAARDVISAIGPAFPGKVILHWFSGSLSDVRKALNCGFWFSVNIAMTQSENGRTIIAEIPPDRLLTETDGPFVKPNGITQGPLDVPSVVLELARMWNVDECEAKARISSNFDRIHS